jgi:hypothetical protein
VRAEKFGPALECGPKIPALTRPAATLYPTHSHSQPLLLVTTLHTLIIMMLTTFTHTVARRYIRHTLITTAFTHTVARRYISNISKNDELLELVCILLQLVCININYVEDQIP